MLEKETCMHITLEHTPRHQLTLAFPSSPIPNDPAVGSSFHFNIKTNVSFSLGGSDHSENWIATKSGTDQSNYRLCTGSKTMATDGTSDYQYMCECKDYTCPVYIFIFFVPDNDRYICKMSVSVI